jgi:hypothetical protein
MVQPKEQASAQKIHAVYMWINSEMVDYFFPIHVRILLLLIFSTENKK